MSRIICIRTIFKMRNGMRLMSSMKSTNSKSPTVCCTSLQLTTFQRTFANTCKPCSSKLDSFKYEKIVDETLEKLTDEFDRLLGSEDFSGEFDTSLNNGVLNVVIEGVGTYVINKQSTNQQIWLSSPISGPKRYDYVSGKWIYLHDGISLEDLLNQELSKIMKISVTIDLSARHN